MRGKSYRLTKAQSNTQVNPDDCLTMFPERKTRMTPQKDRPRNEALLEMLAEAVWRQAPSLLRARRVAGRNPKREIREVSRMSGRICGEPADSHRCLRAEDYGTAMLQLGALPPNASFTELKAALDLANEAWWQLHGSRALRVVPKMRAAPRGTSR